MQQRHGLSREFGSALDFISPTLSGSIPETRFEPVGSGLTGSIDTAEAATGLASLLTGLDAMPVFQIARWSEVFETAESRKYKALPWISERTSFDSTGWQQGLDDFGPEEWPRIYGAWMVIVRVAATAKLRGRLAGDRGEPFSAKRIARPSGICPNLIDSTIAWAIKVGWLVEVLPGDSPGGLPECRENLTATERNGTEHNRTERDGTEAAPGPVRSGRGLFLKTLSERAKDKPKVLELIVRPVEPLVDDQTPVAPLQCFNACGWDDRLIDQLKGSDRAEARERLFAWFRRQLAAPDPVVDDPTAAAAVVVITLADETANRPGITNRAAWFRSQLKSDKVPGMVAGLSSIRFNAAAKWIAERLAVSQG
jgi:hypothetical protein